MTASRHISALAPAAPMMPQHLVFPRPVAISLGANVIAATALAARSGRRGHQTLIGLNNRLIWVATRRVADLGGLEPYDGFPAA